MLNDSSIPMLLRVQIAEPPQSWLGIDAVRLESSVARVAAERNAVTAAIRSDDRSSRESPSVPVDACAVVEAASSMSR